MSLSDEQHEFAKDLALLLLHIALSDKITKFTVGDVFRSPEEQLKKFDEGFSKTQHSQHQLKKAVDVNFWVRGEYAMTFEEHRLREELREIGDYWEALSDKNRWGGFFNGFPDFGHFERKD